MKRVMQETHKKVADELFEHYQYKADPKQEMVRIDKFLLDRMERVTRTKIQNGIKEGFILVNGGMVKPNYKIRPFDVVSVRWLKPNRKSILLPQNIPLDVRYEDAHIMVVYKPAGMVVHPGIGNHKDTLVNALAYRFRDLPILRDGSAERPGIVHRIDKNTTGLMVVAKTEQAMTGLSKQFHDHTIHRRYNALVWGNLEEDEGTIEGHIGRHPRFRKLRHVFEEGDQGKHATTHYKVIRRFGYVTLVECRLETGRTHQIRVHMKHIGHTLFSDEEYGGNRILKGTVYTKYKQFVENTFRKLPHQALHARSLGFVHPATGKSVYFEAAPPVYFQEALYRWEKYIDGRLKR